MKSSMLRAAFTTHASFSEISSLYDGFILDQYGVMHNGKIGLPGATECVGELSSKGKKLIILSNTSSPSKPTFDRLPKLGFDKKHFEGVVTSGDEASKYISEKYGRGPEKKKALWITWANGKTPRPLEFLELCGGVEATDSVDDADFVILHGCEVIRDHGEDGDANETSLGSFISEGDFSVLDPILERCKACDLPMICANPDFIVVKPDGSTAHMPGKIAQRYESIGGECTYFGKPHALHFEACLRELGLEKHRVAHVGDSLHHDVAGANAAGISSVFVAGGIHREELGSEFGELPEEDSLQKVFAEAGHTPTHVVPLFKM